MPDTCRISTGETDASTRIGPLPKVKPPPPVLRRFDNRAKALLYLTERAVARPICLPQKLLKLPNFLDGDYV